MDFEPIINIDSVKDKVIYQYSESTNLIDYIKILLAPFDELEKVFADILNKRLFDNATTHALDVWGNIVVQPRDSYDTTELPFLGLDADDEFNPAFHKGLGDLNDLSIGGIFRSIEQPIADLVYLTNGEYKNTLIGKQHKNNYKGGTEALIEAITEIYKFEGTGNFEVRDNFTTPSDPFVDIEFFQQLTDAEKSYLNVLNILPKPGGIRFEYTFV